MSIPAPVTALTRDVFVQRVPAYPLNIVSMLPERKYAFACLHQPSPCTCRYRLTCRCLPDGSSIVCRPDNEELPIRRPSQVVHMFAGDPTRSSTPCEKIKQHCSLEHLLQSPMLLVLPVRRLAEGHIGSVRWHPNDDVPIYRQTLHAMTDSPSPADARRLPLGAKRTTLTAAVCFDSVVRYSTRGG